MNCGYLASEIDVLDALDSHLYDHWRRFGEDGSHDGTVGRAHRRAPLHRAQLARRARCSSASEDVEGVFTPGELLKIALAACSGMSSDQPLRSRLGDDYQATIRVSGPADREQERYPLLEENLEIDLSGLSEDEVTRLLTVVERAVDKVCTVGRTLKSGTEVTLRS